VSRLTGQCVGPSDMRRLCLLVPEFRADGHRSGGVDTVAQFVLDAFTPEHGWTVQVASPRMSHRAGESGRLFDPRSWMAPRERDVVLDGVPIRYFGANLAELELARYQPRAAMTRFLDEFDAVLVVSGSPAIANVTAKTRRPVVAQIATFIKEERRSIIDNATGPRRARIAAMTRLVARVDDRALRTPRVTLVMNQHMLHECRARGVNVQLIAPGVDCGTYHPAPEANRSRMILAVGRWDDDRKDLSTLLRAFARSRHHDGIEQKLVLAGLQGPTAQDRTLMEYLGVEDAVEVRENVPLEQLAELYRSADLFALTSTEEGLGLVFLEAMASGTPVVATATEGAQFVLGDSGAGELVAFGPDLVDRFSSALTRWCQDAERRKHASIAARQNVEERFNARDAGARLRRVVEDSLT
jgi:glycosyltransferase involved in cell wall biosynthesis